MINPTRTLDFSFDKDLRPRFKWIDSFQGERHLQTFLALNPDKVEPEAKTVGIEVYIPNLPNRPKEADLILMKGHDYFVVDCKDDYAGREKREKEGMEQVEEYAELLEKHLKDAEIKYDSITPVLAFQNLPEWTAKVPNLGDSVKWLDKASGLRQG